MNDEIFNLGLDHKTQKYIKNRTLEITSWDCFNFGAEMCTTEFLSVIETGGLKWVDHFLKTVNYKTGKDLVINGLNRAIEGNIKDSLIEIARICEIPIEKLIQAITLKAFHYYNLQRYINSRGVILDEYESILFIEGSFSRQELENWPIYVYLGSLFLN